MRSSIKHCMRTVAFLSILLSSLTAVEIDTSLFQAMEWRNIGPFRGGRSTTATVLWVIRPLTTSALPEVECGKRMTPVYRGEIFLTANSA